MSGHNQDAPLPKGHYPNTWQHIGNKNAQALKNGCLAFHFLRALWAPASLCRYRGAWLLGLALLLGACDGGGGGESAGGAGIDVYRQIVGTYENTNGQPFIIGNDNWKVYPRGVVNLSKEEVYQIIEIDRASQTVIVEITFTDDPIRPSDPCPGRFSTPSSTNSIACFMRFHWLFDANDVLHACVVHGEGY